MTKGEEGRRLRGVGGKGRRKESWGGREARKDRKSMQDCLKSRYTREIVVGSAVSLSIINDNNQCNFNKRYNRATSIQYKGSGFLSGIGLWFWVFMNKQKTQKELTIFS